MRRTLVKLLVIGLIAASAGCRPAKPAADSTDEAAPVAIELTPEGTCDVRGLDQAVLADLAKLDAAQRAEVLQVFVDTEQQDIPPILGETVVEDGVLRWKPRFRLQPGMRYRAVFDGGKVPGGDPSLSAVTASAMFEVPRAEAGTAPTVEHIFPSADAVPENQLKFYLHFSEPMSRGEAYRHVHLLDAEGQERPDVFLELGEELWDPTMRRFTLLFDPGRVKRGLKPREELGPVLEEGKAYTLVVDRDWPSAQGVPLDKEYRKAFHVLPPDDRPVDTQHWQVEPPAVGSRDPVTVLFGESLDHSLLERVVSVRNAAGETLQGAIAITDHETCWRFTPEAPWAVGDYRLVVATTLEDLAGNAIGRAFDVDVESPLGNKIETDTVSIPFTVDAAK